jgi:hypothetical protein
MIQSESGIWPMAVCPVIIRMFWKRSAVFVQGWFWSEASTWIAVSVCYKVL